MRISMKEIWRNLHGPSKNKELWSYVVKFEFSRPKSISVSAEEREMFYLTTHSTHFIYGYMASDL